MREVLRTIYAPGKKHKVQILLTEEGRYVIESSSLYEYEGITAWEDTTTGLHLFDDLHAAVEAARELLRNESGEDIDQVFRT